MNTQTNINRKHFKKQIETASLLANNQLPTADYIFMNSDNWLFHECYII